MKIKKIDVGNETTIEKHPNHYIVYDTCGSLEIVKSWEKAVEKALVMEAIDIPDDDINWYEFENYSECCGAFCNG